MKARIEPKSAIVRVWVDDDAKYGDPYEWVAFVQWISPGKVEILGYTDRVTKSIWKAIDKECARLGIKKVLAVSYPNGERKERWMTVKSPVQKFYSELMRESQA